MKGGMKVSVLHSLSKSPYSLASQTRVHKKREERSHHESKNLETL